LYQPHRKTFDVVSHVLVTHAMPVSIAILTLQYNPIGEIGCHVLDLEQPEKYYLAYNTISFSHRSSVHIGEGDISFRVWCMQCMVPQCRASVHVPLFTCVGTVTGSSLAGSFVSTSPVSV